MNEEHGGKVWRFEAEGRNGGIGADSSAETVGMKDIAGNGVGGVVRLEERMCSCRGGLKGSSCGGLKGSFCGGLNIDKTSHLQIFHDTIIDVRRMFRSKFISSNPHALTPQTVVLKAGEIRADFCKSDHVEVHVDNRKSVRFCNNNDDDDNIDGNGGTHGSMGRSRGVRRQCKSNRGVRSRCKSNAQVSTTTNTVSVNDDMTTTENDKTTTTTDSTTSHGPMNGVGPPPPAATNRRAIQDLQSGKEAAGIPSGVGVPFQGVSSLGAGERVLPGQCLKLWQIPSVSVWAEP